MWRLDLSSKLVAIIISLCYSATCTGFVHRSAYPSDLRYGLKVCLWTWTGLPGRRPSPGHQVCRLTTPAVIVDVGIGCPVYATVHYRRPSISRRRSMNMEQFAHLSDDIKFPENLQNQSKIIFIKNKFFFSIVSKLLVFVKCLKFFTLN